MQIEEIRRKNLASLVTEYGTIAALAESADTTESYLSTILSGARNIGAALSRRLEKASGKEAGWLDIDHDATASQANLTRTELELISLYRNASPERQRLIIALARLKT